MRSVLEEAIKRITTTTDHPEGVAAYRAVGQALDAAAGITFVTDTSQLIDAAALIREGLSPALFAALLQAGPHPALLATELTMHDIPSASARLFAPASAASPSPLEALAKFILTHYNLFRRDVANVPRKPPLSLLLDDGIRCLAQAVKCEAVAFELGRLPLKDAVLEACVTLFAYDIPTAAQEKGPMCCLHGAATLLLQNLNCSRAGTAALRRARRGRRRRLPGSVRRCVSKQSKHQQRCEQPAINIAAAARGAAADGSLQFECGTCRGRCHRTDTLRALAAAAARPTPRSGTAARAGRWRKCSNRPTQCCL